MSVTGFTATPIGWKHTLIVATTFGRAGAAAAGAAAAGTGASAAAARRDKQIRYLAVRMTPLLAGGARWWPVLDHRAPSTGETCATVCRFTAGAAYAAQVRQGEY